MDAKVALVAVPVKEVAVRHPRPASVEGETEKAVVTLVAHEDEGKENVISMECLAENANAQIGMDKEKEQDQESPANKVAEPLAIYQMEQVVVSQEVATTDSPSEISVELTPSEGTSSELPAKPAGIATCMRGCFEWMPSRRR